jgi:hypothetical protein
MPRNITVTFDDGSTHVYQNAPDDITPEMVTERAKKEFSKAVKALDGGRSAQGDYAKSSSEVPITGFNGEQIPATPEDPNVEPEAQPESKDSSILGSIYDFAKRTPNDVYSTAEDVAQTGGAILSGIGSDILGKVSAVAGGGYPTDPEKQSQIYEQVTAANQYVPTRQGAIENLSTIAKLAEPLATLPPVIGVAAPQLKAIVSSASMRPELPKDVTPSAEMQQALDINRGSNVRQLAGKMTTAQAPMKAVNDPDALQAMKNGVPDDFVQTAKQIDMSDQKKLAKMLDIIERGEDDMIYRKNNRPSDVVGDSLADRIIYVRDINKKAGEAVGKESKALKGKMIDLSQIKGNAANKLYEDLRVRFDKKGNPVFERSAIKNFGPDEAVVRNVVEGMRDAKDALDLHNLKDYIYNNVEFAKNKDGNLRPKTEKVMKDISREINSLLGSNFEAYGKANAEYSETIGALSDMQKRAGSIDIYGDSASGLGSQLRKTLSNAPGREPLKEAVYKIDAVAKKYGANFEDDLKTQVDVVDDLEKIFNIRAPTSIGGEMDQTAQTIQSLAEKGATRTAFDKGFSLFKKPDDKRRKEAINSIRKLLRKQNVSTLAAPE